MYVSGKNNALVRSVTKWNEACDKKVAKIDKLHQSNKELQAALSSGKSD